MSAPGSPQRLAYSVRDVAEVLGVSTDTVYELIRGNKIPHRRLGRRILIPVQAFTDWLNAEQPWGSFDAS